MYDPTTAVTAGLLDEVVSEETLMASALAEATRLKGLNLAAHAATKLKAREALLKKLDWAIEEDYKSKMAALQAL